MKKIFSFVIVLAAVAMVSCGGNTNSQAAEAVEVEATEVVAAPVADTTACCAAQADTTACQKAEGECCKK